ncbi:LysR family transcriptional regulator [Rhodococcus erythropolis]|uniref:LysR substrate-binding domain-containing protein n=1 Tax=Rhodococcus erythropolis TaxID=1833 RepID=UPI00301323C4
MDVQQLEMFVAVAEEGSIHGGARRLRIAQPAVSKSLRKLERQLGTELLVRSPQGIGLTVAGEVLLVQAREILDRVGRTVEIVRKAGYGRRHLVVGLVAGVIAAAELTSEIIRQFREDRPDVSVTLRELDFPSQFSAVTDGRVDVALVRPPCPTTDLALTPLFEEPIVLCCRTDHPLAGEDQLEVGDILNEPMLDMADSPQLWKDFWLLADERHEQPVTGQSVQTVSELGLALACNNRTVMPIASSTWRLGVAGVQPLTTIPLRGAPATLAAVAVMRSEHRDEVNDFVSTAKSVVRQRIKDVPGAELHA